MQQEPLSTAYLTIQQGAQAGKRIEICKDCTTIGRSRHCDIFLEDIAVHRKQASILYTNAGYVLRDDHGSGDSLINEQPVTEQLMKDGDLLHFGHTTLIFYAQEATRPIQLPSSRGRELYKGKQLDPNASAIGRLDLSSRPGTLQSFELQPEVTIGRSRDCSIFLEDLAVSRLHATIRQLSNGVYEIEDHQSATGTFVNGQPVTRSPLKAGDIVQIGISKLTFHY
ncbi:MAG: FHA domain-containing protein [Chloroflexota bacterium]|nr:FHA domain-containing protein [Chloroflexota bacterium]